MERQEADRLKRKRRRKRKAAKRKDVRSNGRPTFKNGVADKSVFQST